MRILKLCHEFPPIGGGAANICAALGKKFVESGHEVVVVTMGFGDLPAQETIDGCQLLRVPCGRKRREMASPWEGLRWAKNCLSVVTRLRRDFPFDVTHSHFAMPAGIVAREMKRRFGLPYLITLHGSDVPGYNRERLKLAHRLARPWWKRICRGADQVVSSSASLLTLVRQTLPDLPGIVIPNGFEPGRFAPRAKEQRILLCSRLVERKGFQYFLEAIAELDLPGWEVDLVGDGPMRGRLDELAARCRTPVHMHGWIDNADPRLAELYERAMIVAFPSEWENFPMALLEGMSAGSAVITTNVSGNPEAVGDSGVLVPPRDIAALRRATLELTSDPARCLELGEKARTRATGEFSWRKIADRFLAELAKISLPARSETTTAGRIPAAHTR